MSDDNERRKKSSHYDPSRRKFLKGVGVAGAGAALAEHLLAPDLGADTAKPKAPGDPISGSVDIALDINGQKRTVTVEPRTTLLSSMRDRLDPGITGPKLVCDMGTCGACTVIMDGKLVYSCLVLAVDAVGKKLTTVEGLGSPDNMNEVQKAFVEHDALMCGFCTPGFVTTISAYLKENSNPTLAEVREACKGNFCRCGTYPRVFEAALAAAKAGATSV
jgi:xanthine dehydrogenase YagT iron-sulfur-binding subunit